MKREKKSRPKTNAKLIGAVIPIVLLMIFIFFGLTEREFLALSREKLVFESKSYAEDISLWTGQILEGLNIYKAIIEQINPDDRGFSEILRTSCGIHEAYPAGLYWGDAQGNHFGATSQGPKEEFNIVERSWYQEGMEHETFAFGEPYTDIMTGNLCVSATVRIERGESAGVLAADVYLDYISNLADKLTEGNVEEAFFVSGGSRMVLASSNASKIGTFFDEEDSLLYENINKLLDQHKMGLSKVKGKRGNYFINIYKIKDTSWYFVTCASRKEVLKELRQLEVIMLFVAIAVSICLIVVTLNVSREMSKIRVKARTDPLTRILNRDGFEERVLLSLETYPNQGILMIIDMDNFKLVNDQLGHPVGDEVLKQFAALLEKYFNRNKDVAARIGGDEFAVFVGREITVNEVEVMLGKFVSLVRQTFGEQYPEQKISASIGAAFVTKDIKYDALYKNADKALYEVKRNGKDGFRIWNER